MRSGRSQSDAFFFFLFTPLPRTSLIVAIYFGGMNYSMYSPHPPTTPFYLFFLQQPDQLWGSAVTEATPFSHTQADISETSVETQGVTEYSWRAGTHFSPVNTPPLLSFSQTHTHTLRSRHTSTRTHTHTQEMQGLVPYQQAHTHLTPHCTHSYQKRMLIT